jgi:GalNAc-alpha-(1->4)-GalNAc-alpha-(1->3)-diNAcBac-PP-undecaprenol alpha-1,4-N-acetyl-D-galactosaminyltransferase
MKIRKICLVIPSLQAGGMERVMTELIYFISKQKDIEQHLILYGITREIFYPVPESVSIHRPSFIFNNKFRLLSTFKTLIYLRKEIKRIDPESILSFGEYWNSFVLISVAGLKYPVFVSDRCQPDKSLGRFHDWLRKRMYPKAKGIIAQTIKAKEIYHTFNSNITVIGNPVRTIKNENNIKKENIVLMVGRLIKSKHQDKLIEIFLNISKPGWKLVIVGYDHLKQNNHEKLKKIISDNHAEHSVILEGKQENVDKYYLKSKIFAFTSSSEGFPNVIGEAMAAGLPVVAFDCVAGPSEMIKDNWNGFLIPLFNYKMFQEKLEFLMDHEEPRNLFGTRATSDIRQFSISKIGEKFLWFILN